MASALLQDDLPARLLPIDRISDYGRLVKITVMVLKFLRVKTPNVHRLAVSKLVRQEQARYYPRELENLQAGRSIPTESRLQRLRPILHEDGTMRLGGRLSNADISEDAKRPFLLQPNPRWRV